MSRSEIWSTDNIMELCSAVLTYIGFYDTTFLYTVFNTVLKWKKLVLTLPE